MPLLDDYFTKNELYNENPVYTIYQQVPKIKCDPYGWPIQGTRQWWKYYYYPQAPSLLDIFADNDVLYAIINFKGINHINSYLNSQWSCQFRKKIILDENNGNNCAHGHTHIIKCPIPYRNYTKVTIRNSYRKFAYYKIPFCNLPKIEGKPKYLHICTQNYPEHQVSLMQWALWHVMQGFSMPTIYLVSDSYHQFKTTLNYSIHQGLIRFIIWDWPYNKNFIQQQGGQLSCIYRSRKRYEWVLLSDVDEFLFSSNLKIKDVIRQYDNDTEIGALKVCNHFYFESDNSSCNRIIDNFDQSDRICDYDRGKCIVRPENVDYISVHTVTKGKKVELIPNITMKSAHLKKFLVKFTYQDPDLTLKQKAKELNSYFQKISEHDVILQQGFSTYTNCSKNFTFL